MSQRCCPTPRITNSRCGPEATAGLAVQERRLQRLTCSCLQAEVDIALLCSWSASATLATTSATLSTWMASKLAWRLNTGDW